jgi:hypothetical protein
MGCLHAWLVDNTAFLLTGLSHAQKKRHAAHKNPKDMKVKKRGQEEETASEEKSAVGLTYLML